MRYAGRLLAEFAREGFSNLAGVDIVENIVNKQQQVYFIISFDHWQLVKKFHRS